MNFKLGDIVQYGESNSYAGLRATVIGFDSRDTEDAVLIGWKAGEDTGQRRPHAISKVSIIGTDILIDNFNEYTHAVWEIPRKLEPANLKGFTKVRRNTLRKRMRDQIAQKVLIAKE